GHHGEYKHAEDGTIMVRSVEAGSDGRDGECAGNFSGDAGKWLYDQRHADPGQKLRRRHYVLAETDASGRWRRSISAQYGPGIVKERWRFQHRLRAHAFSGRTERT